MDGRVIFLITVVIASFHCQQWPPPAHIETTGTTYISSGTDTREYYASDGANVVITCEFQVQRSFPLIRWETIQSADGSVNSVDDTTATNADFGLEYAKVTLALNSVTYVEHAGTYACSVYYTELGSTPMVSPTITLVVLGTGPAVELYSAVGSEAVLSCVFTGRNGAIEWTKISDDTRTFSTVDKQTMVQATGEVVSTLTLNPVVGSDEGSYSCEMVFDDVTLEADKKNVKISLSTEASEIMVTCEANSFKLKIPPMDSEVAKKFDRVIINNKEEMKGCYTIVNDFTARQEITAELTGCGSKIIESDSITYSSTATIKRKDDVDAIVSTQSEIVIEMTCTFLKHVEGISLDWKNGQSAAVAASGKGTFSVEIMRKGPTFGQVESISIYLGDDLYFEVRLDTVKTGEVSKYIISPLSVKATAAADSKDDTSSINLISNSCIKQDQAEMLKFKLVDETDSEDSSFRFVLRAFQFTSVSELSSSLYIHTTVKVCSKAIKTCAKENVKNCNVNEVKRSVTEEKSGSFHVVSGPHKIITIGELGSDNAGGRITLSLSFTLLVLFLF